MVEGGRVLLLTRQSFVPSFEVKLYLFICLIIDLFVDTSVYVSIFIYFLWYAYNL